MSYPGNSPYGNQPVPFKQSSYPPQQTGLNQYLQQPQQQQPYGQPGYPTAPTTSPSMSPYNPQQPPNQYLGQMGQPGQQGPYGGPQQGGYPPQSSPYGQSQQPPSQYPGQPGQPLSQYPGQPGQQGPFGGPPQNQQHWAQSFGANIQPQELQNFQAWFQSVDKDRSGTISAYELATLNISGKPLGLETAKKLIKVFDKNYTGNVDFNEYVNLHQFIVKMQNAFYSADQDRSGTLDSREIFNAMVAAGFQLTFPTIEAICKKFQLPQTPGRITCEGFVAICAHLACVRSIFEWNDNQRTGKVILSYDQLSHITVHLLDRPENF